MSHYLQTQQQTSYTYLHQKIEKISAAIFIVTNLLSDNEPTKWALRKEVVCLLSFVSQLGIGQNISEGYVLAQVTSKGHEVVSLLKVSFYAGLISQMNYSIILSEIEKMLELLQKDPKNAALDGLFADPFFGRDTAKEKTSSIIQKVSSDPARIRQSIDTKTEKKDKKNRQEIILEILEKRGNLGIKDFAGVIKGCSEKTIQRELLLLVKKGLLKKEGDRRWSTYSRV